MVAVRQKASTVAVAVAAVAVAVAAVAVAVVAVAVAVVAVAAAAPGVAVAVAVATAAPPLREVRQEDVVGQPASIATVKPGAPVVALRVWLGPCVPVSMWLWAHHRRCHHQLAPWPPMQRRVPVFTSNEQARAGLQRVP